MFNSTIQQEELPITDSISIQSRLRTPKNGKISTPNKNKYEVESINEGMSSKEKKGRSISKQNKKQNWKIRYDNYFKEDIMNEDYQEKYRLYTERSQKKRQKYAYQSSQYNKIEKKLKTNDVFKKSKQSQRVDFKQQKTKKMLNQKKQTQNYTERLKTQQVSTTKKVIKTEKIQQKYQQIQDRSYIILFHKYRSNNQKLYNQIKQMKQYIKFQLRTLQSQQKKKQIAYLDRQIRKLKLGMRGNSSRSASIQSVTKFKSSKLLNQSSKKYFGVFSKVRKNSKDPEEIASVSSKQMQNQYGLSSFRLRQSSRTNIEVSNLSKLTTLYSHEMKKYNENQKKIQQQNMVKLDLLKKIYVLTSRETKYRKGPNTNIIKNTLQSLRNIINSIQDQKQQKTLKIQKLQRDKDIMIMQKRQLQKRLQNVAKLNKQIDTMINKQQNIKSSNLLQIPPQLQPPQYIKKIKQKFSQKKELIRKASSQKLILQRPHGISHKPSLTNLLKKQKQINDSYEQQRKKTKLKTNTLNSSKNITEQQLKDTAQFPTQEQKPSEKMLFIQMQIEQMNKKYEKYRNMKIQDFHP